MSDARSQAQVAAVIGELKTILATIFRRDTAAYTGETRLFNGGASLNSTQMIELTLAFERHYDIELEPELLTPENFLDLDTLARVICRHLPDAAAAEAAE